MHFRHCYLYFPAVSAGAHNPLQYLESMRHGITEQYFTCRNGSVSPISLFLSRGRWTSSGSTTRLQTSTQYVSELKMESWQPAGTSDILPLSRSIWINSAASSPSVPSFPPFSEARRQTASFSNLFKLRHPRLPRGSLNREAALFKECDRRYQAPNYFKPPYWRSSYAWRDVNNLQCKL